VCGARRFKDEYDLFERMHWVCFHYAYEHGDFDMDEPCDDPVYPCDTNKGWNNDCYHTSNKSIYIVSIDKKSIISMILTEEDIMGFGFNFDVSIKDVDHGWIYSRVWIEKAIIKDLVDNLSDLYTDTIEYTKLHEECKKKNVKLFISRFEMEYTEDE
jgi:hypothetical protein